MFETPILFLIFNRPDTAQIVFAEIKKLRPKYLFVAADGPRQDKDGDQIKCEQSRDIIKQIDWDCELKVLFRDKNLGCKLAISSAIDWFFDQVEEGVILEDDCLPNDSFFEFCRAMLATYKEDERVMMIGGTNYLFNKIKMENSYFFTRNFAIWGWATWRRSWRLYDIEMKDWPYHRKQLKFVFKNFNLVQFFKRHYDLVYHDKIDTWDLQWHYSCLFQFGLCIAPKYNLVTNIGESGTHTPKAGKKNKALFLETKTMDCQSFIHPSKVGVDYDLESRQFKNSGFNRFAFIFYIKFIAKKILRQLKLRKN